MNAHIDLQIAKTNLEISLTNISKWMKDSGLKINKSKTELCVFTRTAHQAVSITVNGTIIESKNTMNVLGLLFDSKLQWGPHVAKILQKADRALNAIKLIKRFFNEQELLQIITSNYYSIMYYNSEVWHTPILQRSLKKRLLSASARAIKVCAKSSDMWMLNFEELHEMAGRADPRKLMYYKLSLQLHKTFNLCVPTTDWVNININSIFTSRQTTFSISKENNYKIGMNALSKRLWYLNGRISLDWLNLSFDSFKIKCKDLFLR